MATLFVGHKRGRSSSTTTAIQRPSLNTTTRTMSSMASTRPRRLSTEGMSSSLPLSITPINSTGKAKDDRRSSSWWIPSMAASVGSYLRRGRTSLEMSESGESNISTPSAITPPLSPASQQVPDWSPRAANHTPYSPLLFVILLFPLSTALVIGSVWTLPVRLPSSEDDTPHSIFPRTISDVRALAWALKGYSETGHWELIHVLAVLSVTAAWKHAWSIPGSVLLNILTGTLLPPVLATLLQTSLTTLGSVLSTILATPLTPIITRFFPSAIELTRSALEGPSSPTITYPPSSPSVLSSTTTLRDSLVTPPPYADKPRSSNTKSTNSSPWARLAVLRLIGIVPWSGINVACGVCGVKLKYCATGAFIGTLPWTAVTCQIGDILQTFASSPVSPNSSNGTHQTISSILTSPQTVFKLIFLTFISLAPILARERLSAWLNGPAAPNPTITLSTNMMDQEIKERAYLEGAEERKSRRGHKKRFSVEWWRRSLSLARPSKDEEEEVELLGVPMEDRA